MEIVGRVINQKATPSHWIFPGLLEGAYEDSEVKAIYTAIKWRYRTQNIDPYQLLKECDKSRKLELVWLRHIFKYFLKKYTRMSLSKIAELVCPGQDHATTLNSIKKVNNVLDTIRLDLGKTAININHSDLTDPKVYESLYKCITLIDQSIKDMGLKVVKKKGD